MAIDTTTTEQIETALQMARWFTQEEYPEVIYLGVPNSRKGKRIRRACPYCGKIYYLRPSDVVRRKYCSNECVSESQRKQTVVAKCRICGKEMELQPNRSKRKYCSKECLRMADRSKPNSTKRRFRCSHKWQRIRKERTADFGHICPVTLRSDKTDLIQVHHIDFDYTNNEQENLIPLWSPFHRYIHARAEMSSFCEAKDRAILLSITEAWKLN